MVISIKTVWCALNQIAWHVLKINVSFVPTDINFWIMIVYNNALLVSIAKMVNVNIVHMVVKNAWIIVNVYLA